MGWHAEAAGFLAGFLLAMLTAPVGVSGAVFLLPFQLSVLQVPSPSVTPTNLMYNVVASPGAVVRYARRGQLDRSLTAWLVTGSVPGVVLGAVIRVYLAADPHVFRLLAAAVLAPLGLLILRQPPASRPQQSPRESLSPGAVRALAFGVGVVGGIYGVGGGSLLAPILVASGMAIALVAPAALASTWLTSMAGVGSYAILAVLAPGAVAPDWGLGLATGLGGLLGGWVGATLQPRLPERALRTILGVLALGLAALYAVQGVR